MTSGVVNGLTMRVVIAILMIWISTTVQVGCGKALKRSVTARKCDAINCKSLESLMPYGISSVLTRTRKGGLALRNATKRITLDNLVKFDHQTSKYRTYSSDFLSVNENGSLITANSTSVQFEKCHAHSTFVLLCAFDGNSTYLVSPFLKPAAKFTSGNPNYREICTNWQSLSLQNGTIEDYKFEIVHLTEPEGDQIKYFSDEVKTLCGLKL